MISIIFSAIPTYGLALMYWAYWLDPTTAMPLSMRELSIIIQIEGLLAFFSIFVFGSINRRDIAGTLKIMCFIFGIALAFSLAFDAEQRKVFMLLLFIHLAGGFQASVAERSRLSLVSWISLPVLLLTYLFVESSQIHAFAERYPPGITDSHYFGYMRGHEMLAWGTIYFSITATVYLLIRLIKYPDEWEHSDS